MRRAGDGVTKIRTSTRDKVTHPIRKAGLTEDLKDGPVGEDSCVGGLPHRHLCNKETDTVSFLGSFVSQPFLIVE